MNKSNKLEKNQHKIKKIIDYLKIKLTPDILQNLINYCNSINEHCKEKKDGCGLSGGTITDSFIMQFFEEHLDKSKFTEYHKKESDLKICKIPLSLKKISGKTQIALDWSKNKTEIKKDYFTNNIMIINLKSGKWWHKGDNTKQIGYGIYIIDKNFCKKNVEPFLASNNKTNTMIKPQYVYEMIMDSIQKENFIELPEINKKYKLRFDFVQSK